MLAKRVAVSVDDEGVVLTHNKLFYRLRFDTKQVELIASREDVDDFVAIYGVVGKLDVGCGYLIVITSREEVESVDGKAIYMIKEVQVVPLERQEAVSAIDSITTIEHGDESEEDVEDEVAQLSVKDASVVEDVLLKRAPSTIALRSWFPSPASSPAPADMANKKRPRSPEASLQLVPKLLKFIRALFKSNSFYYSFDLDLTNSLASYSTRPRQVFVFNRHMNMAFAHTPLCLPIIQGFIKSVPIRVAGSMDVDGDASKVMLISRRSTKRAGVRYLRRGIDDNGHCANWVETDQLLFHDGDIYSYVQVRGSIPVYFKQSPYKLHPSPKLYRKREDSSKAFKKHFQSLNRNYGQVLAVSLAEMPPSREAAVGLVYSEIAQENNVALEWFDFHNICKGMRFDRVTEIFDTQVGAKLDEFGWADSQGKVQKGVFRVNCIDCLDRTNVVEAACARRVLEQQLASLELEIDNVPEFDKLYNGLWADNGDAISRQYSSTNALKGDFTRTKQRNYRGVLTDAFLAMSRYYYGMVTDFFLQAVLDYALGNVGESVFEEFEQHLQSRDPAVNFDSVRNSAIEIAASIVVASDNEKVLGGWWLLTPRKPNRLQQNELMDCILLVTDTAVYTCNYNVKDDKVLDFDRVSATHVTAVQTGTYFGDILSNASKDPGRNVGLVLKYDDTDTLKSSSYKAVPVNSNLNVAPTESATDSGVTTPNAGTAPSFRAFKVPRLHAEEHDHVVAALMSACHNALLEEQDIITLEQAKSGTGMWSSFEYQMKKAVWG